jgi:hypothetical protein
MRGRGNEGRGRGGAKDLALVCGASSCPRPSERTRTGQTTPDWHLAPLHIMSRQSMAPQRNLSLTEELEKLEQSITLTLQEIDHNFSRAHRIVTTGILPIVENYGKHSEAVWEGSKVRMTHDP